MTTKTEKADAWFDRKWSAKDDLLAPLKWRQRRLLVDRYHDLFDPKVTDAEIDEVFGVMLACVTLENVWSPFFHVVTRNVHRMTDYFKTSKHKLVERWAKAMDGKCIVGDGDVWFSEYIEGNTAHKFDESGLAPRTSKSRPYHHLDKIWPLPNLVLGVDVPDQAAADRRLPALCKLPSPLKLALCEPLRGPVDLSLWLYSGFETPPQHDVVNFVVAGGDVGDFTTPAQPTDLAWLRALRAQCKKSRTPFFLTRLGRRPIGKWGKTDVIEPRMNNRPGREGEFMLRSRDGIDRGEWPLDLRAPQILTGKKP